MKKTESLFEFFSAVTKGAVEIYEKSYRIYLSRFTKEQRKRYFSSPDYYMKTRATSGIRLCFKTRADKISLSGKIEAGSSRNFYGFDVYVNGIMHSHFSDKYNIVIGKDFSIEFSLPEGDNDIVIYLPQLACASFSDFCFDGVSVADSCDGAYSGGDACTNELKAIFFGDSITQGYDSYHPSFSYPSILARRFDFDYINKGIGGDVHNSDVLATDSYMPDMIFVAYGTNDWKVRLTRKSFVDNIEAYHHKLRALYPETPVIVFSPVWRADNDMQKPAGNYFGIFDTICDICKNDKNITVLDGLGFVARSEEMFSDKYLHPTELGFFVYADSVCRKICLRTDSGVCRMLAERAHF